MVESWEGVLNATRLPYACPQPRTDNGPTNEDCLYMSIYLPLSFEHDKKAKRDVAVVRFHFPILGPNEKMD
jgi:carboxylesterase type B